MGKTNERWYFFWEVLGYCRLVDGAFLYQPSIASVEELFFVYQLDWSKVPQEHLQCLRDIEAQLQEKP